VKDERYCGSLRLEGRKSERRKQQPVKFLAKDDREDEFWKADLILGNGAYGLLLG
jgi:hypothetical protein